MPRRRRWLAFGPVSAAAPVRIEKTRDGDWVDLLLHGPRQGADTAGFWIDENGGTRILGLPVVTTTAIPSKTAIVGDFKAATLFVGDQFRIDVSTEAGDRWDKNLTGFREIAFNADPPVLAGAFQAVTTLIP